MWPLISSKAISAALKQRDNPEVQIAKKDSKGKGKAARGLGSKASIAGGSVGAVNTTGMQQPRETSGMVPHSGSEDQRSGSALSVAGTMHRPMQPMQNGTGYELLSAAGREKQAALHGELLPNVHRAFCRVGVLKLFLQQEPR